MKLNSKTYFVDDLVAVQEVGVPQRKTHARRQADDFDFTNQKHQ